MSSSDGTMAIPTPDPDEVSDWRWVTLADLAADLSADPPPTRPGWFRRSLLPRGGGSDLAWPATW